MGNIYKGTLKQWNEDKGFGFIRPENSKRDVFIHISALKNMSRRPIAGDIISYQIHTGNDGKNRAVNASIEGVATAKQRVKRKAVTRRTHNSSNPFPKLLFLGLLIFAGFFFYNNFFKKKNSLVVSNFPVVSAPKQVKHNFKCDGREHCSQMNSRAEAVFFIRNCPNTKMDGDYDGIPCENDSRF
jgi:cold shock CspA family protein